jgi:hypothetical protein
MGEGSVKGGTGDVLEMLFISEQAIRLASWTADKRIGYQASKLDG